MSASKRQCVAVALCILGAGCVIRDDFTALSTKNVNLSNVTLSPEESKGNFKGEECQNIFIIIPDTFHTPTMKGAVDKAIERGGGNLLLNTTVEYQWFYFPLLFLHTCWIASGDVYDTYR